ncbi:MAG: alanine racemase [Xanthomonadales bacterium]|nr:alanine racemase [Xanthomonadales bacterium]
MSRGVEALIDPGALIHNLEIVRRLAPAARVMAVVKAEAYGHGLERVARILAGRVEAFGVAGLEDAERLRAAGIGERIVLLSGVQGAEDAARAQALAAEQVVHDPAQLAWFREARGRPLPVWLKLETGMHRLGFMPEHLDEAWRVLSASPAVSEIVWMSHLASSDVPGDAATAAQLGRFAALVGGRGGERSLANSAALLLWPETRAGWVRVGGLLYGLTVIAGRCGADFGLRPAMRLRARLIARKWLRRGARVGYGGSYACPEDMPVGIAAVGYGDGYPRHLPSGAPVLVGERLCALAGRVSMDLIAIDLRAAPEARPGSVVTLWGPELPAERVAEAAGTIAYELTCGVTRRVQFVEAASDVEARPSLARA